MVTSEQIRPSYAGAFRCTGTECEDTCCREWTVNIDRQTYEKYQSLPDIQPRLQECMVIKDAPTELEYARIQYTPSGVCPFLSPERLCEIHKKYGGEYLSRICATYPRNTIAVVGVGETSVALSCPEAARLVLLNPRLLPEADASSTHARYRQFLLNKAPAAASNGDPLAFFFPLRSFIVALLKDPRYPLWQRLFILGQFCARLQELAAAGQTGLIPKLLHDYAEIIMEKKLREPMDRIPVHPVPQLEVAGKFGLRANRNPHYASFNECLDEFMRGIQFDPALPLENCVPAYSEACARYYRPFMDAHPFLLENYLVDFVLSQCFPLSRDPKARNQLVLVDAQVVYFMLCIHFAVIQAMLIGIAGYHREAFGAKHVVRLIYSFTRVTDHCPGFLQEVQTSLKDANLMNSSGMALLLKSPADYRAG